MTQDQPMTVESAEKTIKHVQKVFYVVGGLNLFFLIFALPAIRLDLLSMLLVINFFMVLAILIMGWSLDKSFRHMVPKAAFILSVSLLLLSVAQHIVAKRVSLGGFIFPVALWVIGKQSQRAIKVLEGSKK